MSNGLPKRRRFHCNQVIGFFSINTFANVPKINVFFSLRRNAVKQLFTPVIFSRLFSSRLALPVQQLALLTARCQAIPLIALGNRAGGCS